MRQVYLDNAATTPIRPEVVEVMKEALNNTFGNPSSTHSFGRSAKSIIEKARKTIAKELKAHPSEIIFTSGGTEADNMILSCAVDNLGVQTIITSKIEHHAVLHAAERLHEVRGTQLKFVDLDEKGNPKMEHLETLLSADGTRKLVSLMHVNNEIGNLLDLEKVGSLCEQYHALFHSDTVQSIGHLPWDVSNTKVHFLTAAAHKFHGPKGIGFAYIRKNSGLGSMIVGGSQERGYRAGTEGVHNVAGMERAFVAAYEHLEQEKKYVEGLKSYFIDRIKKEIPEVCFNGHSADLDKSTYTLVNLRLPLSQEKALMLLFHLDLKGIACSKGSACQSGSDAGSHVLSQLLPAEELKKPSLRFSFSMFNTKEEIDYTIQQLKEFCLGE